MDICAEQNRPADYFGQKPVWLQIIGELDKAAQIAFASTSRGGRKLVTLYFQNHNPNLQLLSEDVFHLCTDLFKNELHFFYRLLSFATQSDLVHLEKVCKLLHDSGNAPNKQLQGELVIAAFMGHILTMLILLRSGMDANQPYFGQTEALAVRNKQILKQHAEFFRYDTLRRDPTPLIAATVAGHNALCRLLVHSGANVNGVDKFACSAGFHALRMNNARLYQILANELGSDLKIGFAGKSPLHIAGMFCDGSEIFEYLIRSLGIDPNNPDNSCQTPLMAAVIHNPNPRDAVTSLMRLGGNPKQKDTYGKSTYSYSENNPSLVAFIRHFYKEIHPSPPCVIL